MVDGKMVFKTDIDTSGFEKDTKQLENTAKDTGKHIWEALGGAFKGSFLQDAFSGLIDIGSAAIESASNLEKVQNALDVTFGDDAGRVEAWAASAREQFGLTELQAKQYTSTLGAMLKGMDMSGPQMLEMSTGLAGLAADMASFYNMDSETAFNEISKGLTGQSDKLRQLGVDLSDANMEAYALSEGMGKTFQQMSSGEQAVLRYQYLMKETAAVQGNFAKTSESLAGNMQMLETNWNEFLAGVGEKMEPFISGTVDMLNDVLEALIGGSQTAAQNIENLGANLEKTTSDIEAQAFVANHLADKLIAMGDYSSLSAEGQMEWKAIAEKLISVMPELSSEIDLQTGSFINGTQAVKDHISALEDELKFQALFEAKKSIMQVASESGKNYYDKMAEYESSKAKYENAKRELGEYEKWVESEFKIYTAAELDIAWSNLLMRPGLSFGRESGEIEGILNEWYRLKREVSKFETEMNNNSKGLDELKVQADEAAALASDKIKILDESIEQLGFSSSENLGPRGAAGDAEDLADALTGLEGPAQNVIDLFSKLENYRFENLADVRREFDDTFGLFDKPEKVKKGNIKGDTKNLEAQKEYWERYNAAVEELQKRAGGDEWVAELADGTEESLSKLEMLAYADIELYNDATSARDEAASAMEEAALSVTESKLEVDAVFDSLVQSTTDAVSQFNMQAEAYASGQSTLSGLISGLESQVPGLQAVMSRIMALLALGGFNLFHRRVPDLSDAPTLPGAPSIPVPWLNSISPESIGPFSDVEGFEKGLKYVPYNDFPAILHEGEAVLTKAQASLWRAGWTGAQAGAGSAAAAGVAAGGGSFQQVNNFNVPVQTPDEFAKTMRLYATYGLEGVI